MTLSNPAQYISGRTVQEQMNSLIDYVDQRAADVALDAIASDVAQVHQDMLDADADAAAAAASAAAAAGTLANAVKKTGEASQSIAGDISVAGALSGGSVSSSGNVDGASIGSGTTPITAGDLTAYGNVSLDDTALQGNVSVSNSSALINLAGAGSVSVPTPTFNNDAATKKYVDDADALKISITDINTYAVGLTDNQSTIAGIKGFTQLPSAGYHTRVTGTSKSELFRISATDGNTVISVLSSTRSSFAVALGTVTVTIAAGVITSITKELISNKASNVANIYAHIEDGNLIISIGNEATFNNYISMTILGLFTGAGDVRNPEYSNIGRDTTSLVDSNMRVDLCQ